MPSRNALRARNWENRTSKGHMRRFGALSHRRSSFKSSSSSSSSTSSSEACTSSLASALRGRAA
eukprot:CAMPEP_0177534144 /NCGR_PEP_ID=MMETSP0369-20130122/55755_1 /TAXON_ID=447022 ORGANISM="Scrippsiella hangoei-like, Strain SHHI-4" /NCGR_SAMPLE_ID=MMETSP0369 /ASSEMBLY_ACC=CAM_ASM_000364 /LENGTH=63 /DNA_ID=CAMNT_0019016005 /DNA_START=45 /DNA_END=233 /DNA_ORIENTATION=-